MVSSSGDGRRFYPQILRKTQKFFQEFEEVAPAIRGALYDALRVGLQKLPTVKLEEAPRMADFAKWSAATETGLGWKEGTFATAFKAMEQESMANAVAADPVVQAALKFVEREQGSWRGTATDLLQRLRDITPFRERREGWPKSPHALSRRLKRVLVVLGHQGVRVQWFKGKIREIELTSESLLKIDLTGDANADGETQVPSFPTQHKESSAA